MRKFSLQTLRKRRLRKTFSYLGFGNAPTKTEGGAVSYDSAGQQWTARYQHETIALAFSITEEAEEDGQYGSIASRYTKALARSMSSTKKSRQQMS
jgi:hypothetical protein